MAPHTTPSPRQASSVTPTPRFQTFMQIEAVSTARPKTEPTDKSMPPESITIVSPSTTRPVSANCRLRSVRFEIE
jgi:hypothetical protein